MGGGNVDADLSVSNCVVICYLDTPIPPVCRLLPPFAYKHLTCLYPACALCAQLAMGGEGSISGDVTYKNKDIEATASVNSGSSNIVEKVELVQSQV